MKDVSAYDSRRFSGDGAWITTIEDLSIFFNAFFNHELLEETTLDWMIQQNLGLLNKTVDGLEGIGHDGIAIGYSAEMWYFLEVELKIILLTNQGRISEDQSFLQQWEQLMGALVLATK